MTPPPTPRSGAPVFPGIAKFKAEPPMAGYGHQWQINGCVEDGNPDDIESYGWIAEVNSAWGNESGDLARFLARAANSYSKLVAACELSLAAYEIDDINFDELKAVLIDALQAARS